jgi:hypothetical protein
MKKLPKAKVIKRTKRTYRSPKDGPCFTFGLDVERRIYNKESLQSPELVITCRDCGHKLSIFLPDKKWPVVEIGGVLSDVETWKKILLPILGVKEKH